jgi:hypothetical protein
MADEQCGFFGVSGRTKTLRKIKACRFLPEINLTDTVPKQAPARLLLIKGGIKTRR